MFAEENADLRGRLHDVIAYIVYVELANKYSILLRRQGRICKLIVQS